MLGLDRPNEPGRVLVAGDWHGNTGWALRVIRNLPGLLPDESPRMVLHAGDFGVWPGTNGDRYLHKLTRELARVNGVILFVDGNHDDHHRLAALPVRDGLGEVTERIFHLPRGRRWVWGGRTWLALGGAVSLDRALRVEGRTWWPGEEITRDQAQAVVNDGVADVMITHDCPAGVEHHFGPPPSVWAQRDVERSQAHRALLQDVVDQVQPSHLIHGHLHRAYTRRVAMSHGHVQVRGLDCDGAARGNWAVLDVPTMACGAAHA
ncbi:metallophosphoesterase family protein [Spirillospora sp. CA-294931]|uniref:metallophosphoesterase family protein n=1 Tax=Spirillospora sp. CA-294931 TaxID=3240042 RepID=UPI003D92AEFF